MSKVKLTMKKIKDVLRLKHSMNLSQQAIADATGVPRSTVRDYLLRANAADISWPLPEEMEHEELDALLFPARMLAPSQERPLPDWAQVSKELKRKGDTLQLL